MKSDESWIDSILDEARKNANSKKEDKNEETYYSLTWKGFFVAKLLELGLSISDASTILDIIEFLSKKNLMRKSYNPELFYSMIEQLVTFENLEELDVESEETNEEE